MVARFIFIENDNNRFIYRFAVLTFYEVSASFDSGSEREVLRMCCEAILCLHKSLNPLNWSWWRKLKNISGKFLWDGIYGNLSIQANVVLFAYRHFARAKMDLGIEIFMLKLRCIENFTMFVLALRWLPFFILSHKFNLWHRVPFHSRHIIYIQGVQYKKRTPLEINLLLLNTIYFAPGN
jgi:hypothetical protein